MVLLFHKRSQVSNRLSVLLGKSRIVVRVLRKFHLDHGFLLASAITFNFLICMIPIILLLLTLIGQYFYSSREVLTYITHHLQTLIPSLDPEVMRKIMRIIRHRKIVGILGLGGLLWTSTWVFSSIRTALSIVLRIEKNRTFLLGKAVDLLMVLSTAIFLLSSMVISSAVNILQGLSTSTAIRSIVPLIVRYILPLLFTVGMFFLIYKLIPNKRIHFGSALKTACFTSLMWEAARHLFVWYALHMSGFSMVYGSLSTMAIFFLLVYYLSSILILGAEVAFFLESKLSE
jgi:membrane protein